MNAQAACVAWPWNGPEQEKTVKTPASGSGVEKSGAIVPPASPRERARRMGRRLLFLQIGFHNCGKVLWNQGWWMLITR
jgi:hypothetical protein